MADAQAVPCLFVITGPPASGKTTLAQRLVSDLGVAALGKDEIKEMLFETLGIGDRDWSRALGRASNALLVRFARAQLSAGQSCLVESNFDPRIGSEALCALIAEVSCGPVQVACRGRGDALLARFERRVDTGERHAGHLDAEIVGELREQRLRGHLPPLEIPGPRIEVDTTAPVPVAYASVLEQIERAAHDAWGWRRAT